MNPLIVCYDNCPIFPNLYTYNLHIKLRYFDRLAQEGALMTIPFMSKRIVKPTSKDLEILLLCNDMEKPPDHEELDQATRDQINEMETGKGITMIVISFVSTFGFL